MDSEEFKSIVVEHHTIQQQFRIAAAFGVLVISGGAVFYHYIEHLKWLDSFYFCTITLTTVGYGDIVPKTDAGKLFTILYVFLGIGIIAGLANLMVKNALVRRQLRQTKHKK